jgi:1-acyl-sn-glycerol-3-phosphate acyltransferase
MDLAKKFMKLLQRLNWLRRLVGTAIAFLTFGIGGSLLGLIFPLFNLFIPKAQRKFWARNSIHRVFGIFLKWMRFLGVMDWRVIGAEKLGRKGQLIIANHPSLLDVVFVIAQIKAANCIVKSSLWRNPCMIGPVSAAGYIKNDDTAQMIEQGIEALKAGDCLVVFPEGTRTKPNQALLFQRGAALMAIKGAEILTPVIISVSPSTLSKNEKWFNIPTKRFVMTMTVCDDMELTSFRENNSPPIAARLLNRSIMTIFTSEISDGSQPAP